MRRMRTAGATLVVGGALLPVVVGAPGVGGAQAAPSGSEGERGEPAENRDERSQPVRARASARASASASAYARAEGSDVEGAVSVEGDGTREREGTTVTASTEGGEGTAGATASVGEVEILDGLVRADRVEVSAQASGGTVRSTGRVVRLRIDGELVGSPSRPNVYDLAGHGSVQVLGESDGGMFGLRAVLDEAVGDLPADTTITIAFAAASARDATAPPAAPRRPRRSDTSEADRRSARPSSPRPAPEPRRRPNAPATPSPAGRSAPEPPRRPAPELEALRTSRGFAFPVFGRVSFSNDWGAPRQFTGRHEGTDVFAPAGTPVLAVTSGTLNRVGTRAVPGNRVWLRSDAGDTFFYAHLSAFAEDARNGAQVQAGQVLGFVGNTGDAERTPPHLHFEVHPGGREATNPYPFLRAWQLRRDVPPAAWIERAGGGEAPGALSLLDDFLAG